MARYLTLLLIASTCILTACSHIYGSHGVIQNRSKDYLDADCVSPLRIPPGMSSSTIEAHYPVSEREYPAEQREVKLLPPDLSSSVKEEKSLPTPQKKVAAKISNPATQSDTAPESEILSSEQATAQQAHSHYYDAYTRSANGGVGKPMKAILEKVDDGVKKLSSDKPAFGNSATQGTAQGTSAATQAPLAKQPTAPVNPPQEASNSSQEKPTGSILKSLWPWGKKSETKTADATPSQTTAQASKMPADMYYDRYTRR